LGWSINSINEVFLDFFPFEIREPGALGDIPKNACEGDYQVARKPENFSEADKYQEKPLGPGYKS